MDKLFQVLLVEDDSLHVKILLDYLKKVDLELSISVVSTKKAYLNAITKNEYDLVICDYLLPDFSGLDAFKLFRKQNDEVPFILISSYMNESEGIDAMMNGVTDFLIKDNLRKIIPAAKRELLNYVQRRTIENSLKQSKALISSLESTMDGFAWESEAENLRLTYLSPTFTNILGYDTEQIERNPDLWGDYIHPKDYYRVIEFYIAAKENNLKEIEYRIIDSEGKIRWFRDILTFISDADNGDKVQGLMVDITEIKENEKSLNQSLNEKEQLISELHHRVKNNLAVISSMIQLQALTEQQPDVQIKLIEGVNRIKSMAIVHDIVYQKEKFDSYSIEDGIIDLVKSVIETLGNGDEFEINYSIDTQISSIQQAIPVALILTEIVSNVVKHAYADETIPKKIDISLSEEATEITLSVRDYGKGIPEDLTESNRNTIGISIISALTTQLEGSFSFEQSEPGTYFQLSFSKSSGIDDNYAAHY
jgi:PAS domain S-box-containing protein